MSRLAAWLVAAIVLLLGRRRPRRRTPERPRIVPRTDPAKGAEAVVVLALAGAALLAAGFLVVYALDRLSHQTQLLGATLGGAFLLLSVACIVAGRLIVSGERAEEEYPTLGRRDAEDEIVQIVEESADAFTRRRLLGLAVGGAGATLGLAMLAPAASLGPALHTGVLLETPWRRGRRLVDSGGKPYEARKIDVDAFYTAYPEGAPRESFAAPVVVVRLDPGRLDLPADRRGWAPRGIVAYSKICTHAGCAVSEYRAPLFSPTSERPALVCPCHYSTFDPATGGTVLVGPAGRPLPQLPLAVDADGHLVAGGELSAGPGPSWSGVRR